MTETSARRALRRAGALLALAWAAAAPAAAQDFARKAIATTGPNELTLPVGARGVAMGEAFSAVADDATAIHWNPAGLALIPTGDAAFMHAAYLANISYEFLGYGQRVGERSVLAGSLQFFDYGTLTGKDVNNNPIASFHPRTYIYSLAFAQTVADVEEGAEVSAGVTLKHVRTQIKQSASALAADVGFLTKFASEIPSRAALVVQNMGQGPKYDSARDRLPLTLRGGLAFMPAPWVLSFDLVAPRGNRPYGALGVEFARAFTPTWDAALRAGYNTLLYESGPDGLRGFGFGLGIKVRPVNFSIDYALVPFGDLGLTHRVSLRWSLPSLTSEE